MSITENVVKRSTMTTSEIWDLVKHIDNEFYRLVDLIGPIKDRDLRMQVERIDGMLERLVSEIPKK